MKTTSLSFACIPDVHGRASRLRAALDFAMEDEPDALLATGDFAPAGAPRPGTDALHPAVERVRGILEGAGPPVFTVPGNHDPPGTRIGRSLDGARIDFHGVRMYGVGGAGPQPLGLPYESSDDEMAARAFPDWDLLLSHAPPRNCRLDRTTDGMHVGSAVIRKQVERGRGILVCGHIHEAVGAQVIGRCLCYNAGSLGGPSGATQVGRIELRRGDGARGWRVVHHRRSGGGWEVEFGLEL